MYKYRWTMTIVLAVITGLAIVLSGCSVKTTSNPLAFLESGVEGVDKGLDSMLGRTRDYVPFCEYKADYKLCYVPYASMFPNPKRNAIAQTTAVFLNGEYAYSTITMQAYQNRKGEMVFDYHLELEHEIEHVTAFREGTIHPDDSVQIISKR